MLIEGDILVLDAVQTPGFDMLSDVIIFPVTGHRPHPDETSGGDLDVTFQLRIG